MNAVKWKLFRWWNVWQNCVANHFRNFSDDTSPTYRHLKIQHENQRVDMVYGLDVWSNNSVMKTWKTVYHYNAVMMSAMASQITSVTIVYTTVFWGADQRKYQSSASLAFVWGIHRWPVNSPHKGPVTRKMFPFDDVIMPSKGSFVTEYLQY